MTDAIVRASDAERDAAGLALRRHHAEGRIDTDELSDRINRCYRARTRGELDALLADLPRDRDAAASAQRRAWRIGWPPLPVAALILLLAAAWSGHGHRHGPVVIWPLVILVFIAARTATARLRR
jgi:Domain of unknown function (DUF1707)